MEAHVKSIVEYTAGGWLSHSEMVALKARTDGSGWSGIITRGFAHGFLVLSDEAEFCYKCDDFYHANDEGGLAWNDPEIGIVWPEVEGAYPSSAAASGYRWQMAIR